MRPFSSGPMHVLTHLLIFLINLISLSTHPLSIPQARAAKRETLNWSEFSSAGFSRLDGPLNTTLQFNTTLVNTASSWQTHNAEITKKLKKQQKALPAFGWDTEPVIGSEEVIEEAFLDVFCDLICGSGWLDIDREDVLDRDCNWVLVSAYIYASFSESSLYSLPPPGHVHSVAPPSLVCLLLHISTMFLANPDPTLILRSRIQFGW